MTAQRQERNGWRPGLAFIALAGLAAMADLVAARAATTERVVVDRTTGLALGGFDPVAYFTESRAMAGRPGLEVSEAGAVWRFRNEGNRAFFVRHPEIYGPQFGGYDPIELTRGVAYAGDPRFWLISGQRLFLFGRTETRDAFAADPARFAREAGRRWPGVQETLAR
ncbi:YHS domain-containing (seleno)protein [Bradyrhizobium sp.]|jgi:hypothetical protein|uniref:YHS domain-containing (seleno)protein n=1 Tax=Bradyrhizobium sp. TaxID=376 RepID=UPI002E028EE5|nr:YHS domain-containing (seleno)protein [Bradyrhizobium sp.]